MCKIDYLMQYDIVYHKAKREAVKVVCIYENGIAVKGKKEGLIYGIKPNEIKPIIITEEIAINNGFDEKEGVLINGDVSLFFEKDGVCIEVERDDFYARIDAIKYVHQVQHALMLCGEIEIAKEFELVE